MTVLTVRGGRGAVDGLQVVRLAEHSVVVQRELLAGAQLPLARVAREARQVVDVLASLAHPVVGADAAATLGALGAETSVQQRQCGYIRDKHLAQNRLQL